MAAIFYRHYPWLEKSLAGRSIQEYNYRQFNIFKREKQNKIKRVCNNEQPCSFYLPAGRQVWQALSGHNLKDVQVSFAKHTSKAFLKLLSSENALKKYEVNGADRKHAFWKRDPLGIELFTPAVFDQKLFYIHNNPLQAGLCKYAEEYKYSSALFYKTGEDPSGLLEHWR